MNGRWLAIAALLLAASARGDAPEDLDADSGACLTPVVGDVIQKLFQNQAFASVVPGTWKVSDTRILPHRVELSFKEGTASRRVALIAGRVHHPDGEGAHFSFVILDAADSSTRTALLAAAEVVDRAEPDGSTTPCVARLRPNTRAHQMFVGAAELMVMLAALVYGARALLRPRQA